METVGSEQEVWKLLFFATFITLHIYIIMLPNKNDSNTYINFLLPSNC